MVTTDSYSNRTERKQLIDDTTRVLPIYAGGSIRGCRKRCHGYQAPRIPRLAGFASARPTYPVGSSEQGKSLLMVSYLLDTNVVLRLIDRQDPKHGVCRAAITTLIKRQEIICLAPQVLVEFWVVATRPIENNGFGWSPNQTAYHIGRLCELFQLHPQHPGLFERWLRLAKQAAIHGKRAYDARIAAFMALHGIEYVLTLNPNDFHGFGVNVVEPDTLVDSSFYPVVEIGDSSPPTLLPTASCNFSSQPSVERRTGLTADSFTNCLLQLTGREQTST